jgi:hypothetical protein
MSYYIKFSVIIDGGKCKWEEVHKNWALEDSLAVIQEAARRSNHTILIQCEDEYGDKWDAEDIDFLVFRKEHESTHRCSCSWEEWWDGLIKPYVDFIHKKLG